MRNSRGTGVDAKPSNRRAIGFRHCSCPLLAPRTATTNKNAVYCSTRVSAVSPSVVSCLIFTCIVVRRVSASIMHDLIYHIHRRCTSRSIIQEMHVLIYTPVGDVRLRLYMGRRRSWRRRPIPYLLVLDIFSGIFLSTEAPEDPTIVRRYTYSPLYSSTYRERKHWAQTLARECVVPHVRQETHRTRFMQNDRLRAKHVQPPNLAIRPSVVAQCIKTSATPNLILILPWLDIITRKQRQIPKPRHPPLDIIALHMMSRCHERDAPRGMSTEEREPSDPPHPSPNVDLHSQVDVSMI